MTVGERIRERRLELGLSQKELADRMGYADKTAVSKAETKGDNLNTTKIRKFADAMNCSFEHLMGWDKEESEDDGKYINAETGSWISEYLFDAQFMSYMEKFHKADKATKEKVFKMLDIILNE